MQTPPSSELLALQEALVGRYSVQREIGRGGMGIVYVAHDVALDRPVALKLLPPDFAARPALRERFLREARTAAGLSHPNIVPIHAVEEVGAFVFYVMAYVEGETLKERVCARGPLAPSEAARVLREVAWALAYAHAHGVVHRDVKPDNVMLEAEGGRAMVMDFGIAQVTRGPGLTDEGEILGTAEFMSPEQASGERVDERSDVYAIGVLGHYVLTGVVPFQGDTVAATLAKHLTQPAPSIAHVAPHVPVALGRVIDRCLEKDVDKRFADGEKLAEELSRATEERRVVPVPLRSFLEQTRERFRGMWGWALFVVYFLAIAVAALVAEGPPLIGVGMLAIGLGMAVAPFGLLARMTRALLRAGYDLGDLVHAMEDDLRIRREDRSFELGAKRTWVDRLGMAMVGGGLAVGAFGTLLVAVLDTGYLPHAAVAALGWLVAAGVATALAGLPLAFMRLSGGRRLPGERWLKFWRSRIGGWLFELSGVGLGTPAPAPGYRPTEMLIGTAADRLFGELSRTMRRELAELPDVIDRLEADAARMRGHIEALERLLQEVDQDPRRAAGAGERDRLKGDLQQARDEAVARMNEALSALETIRLGLLRLHAGETSVQRLTEALGSAQELSGQIERLISGHAEVAELLTPSRAGPAA